MALHITEVRRIVKEVLMEYLVLEFEAKDMPAGTSWRHNKGWAAKNKNGVLNYWTTPDSKEKADEFSKDKTRQKDKPDTKSGVTNAA